jgi:hypothetical protein
MEQLKTVPLVTETVLERVSTIPVITVENLVKR